MYVSYVIYRSKKSAKNLIKIQESIYLSICPEKYVINFGKPSQKKSKKQKTKIKIKSNESF